MGTQCLLCLSSEEISLGLQFAHILLRVVYMTAIYHRFLLC